MIQRVRIPIRRYLKKYIAGSLGIDPDKEALFCSKQRLFTTFFNDFGEREDYSYSFSTRKEYNSSVMLYVDSDAEISITEFEIISFDAFMNQQFMNALFLYVDASVLNPVRTKKIVNTIVAHHEITTGNLREYSEKMENLISITTKRDAILDFCSLYDIDEDDISLDTLLKRYYRWETKYPTRSPILRRKQKIASCAAR